MLRCIACGAEGKFEVEELARRTIVVQSLSDWDYHFEEEVELIDIMAWGEATCLTCQHTQDSEEAKAAYDEAHGEDVLPIPYTLVDASIS